MFFFVRDKGSFASRGVTQSIHSPYANASNLSKMHELMSSENWGLFYRLAKCINIITNEINCFKSIMIVMPLPH